MTLYTVFAECKPKEQCGAALPDKDAELLAGMVQVMNDRGCCPSWQTVCVPSTCPVPDPCPVHYERIEIKDDHGCCPRFKCGKYGERVWPGRTICNIMYVVHVDQSYRPTRAFTSTSGLLRRRAANADERRTRRP